MSEAARVRQQFGNTSVTDGSQSFQGIALGDVAMNSTHHHYAALERPERPETPPKPTVVIPFNRDEHFVQRGTVLDQLHSLGGKPASRTALVGFGGVGKSQIAIEYAFQIQERSPDTWVLWVHASNVARYEQTLRDIADYVKLPERKNAEKNIFELLYNWLRSEKSKKWVLILDNVDDASFLVDIPFDHKHRQQKDSGSQRARSLASYLPRCQHGSILITSRSKREALKLVESHNIVDVQPMSEAEAVALAQKKLRRLATQEGIESIKSLVETLEYMPLAIVQATAYILRRDRRCSIQQYLVKFKQSDQKQASLLDYEDGQSRRDWEAKNSILITWQLSFDHIREIRPSASDLLSLMSFCDRQGIPESLLRASNEDSSVQSTPNFDNSRNDGECTNESESSADDRFDDDILILRDYSFISFAEERSTFEMHRLVQLATRRWLAVEGQQDKWKTEFITRLCAQFPIVEYENWGECRVLLPHVKSAVAQRPKGEASLLEWASILHNASWYLLEMGQWHEAHKMAENAIEVKMQILGRDHGSTLASMGIITTIYRQQGHWEKAEKLGIEAMEISKRELGADHPYTLSSMHILASIFGNQGRWEEAEKLGIEVVETRKQKLGVDHPDTLTSMNNLTLIFWKQGRLEEAEKLGIEVVETRKRKLGADHPYTLSSMHILALIFWKQGRLEEAEKLGIEVIETSKRKLGADHPDTLTSMNNLATLWEEQGRQSEALELMRECVSASQRILGAHHPHYLLSSETLKRWELEHTNSNGSAKHSRSTFERSSGR